MKLSEWFEFEQAINAAAAAAELDQRFVEKDYWVTTVLRLVVDELPDKTIFKGGTSLSKGWQLIDRFSEDIDLFVDPTAWEPQLSKNGITRTLRKLKERVEQHPALTYVPDLGETIKGFSREDTFAYGSLYDELPGLPPTVRLEPGIQSGRQPTAVIALNSIAAGAASARSRSAIRSGVNGRRLLSASSNGEMTKRTSRQNPNREQVPECSRHVLPEIREQSEEAEALLLISQTIK